MYRRITKTLPLLVLLLLAIVACNPSLAHADVNNFTVTDFSADETLTNADRQGSLHIIEHIKVRFSDNNHGILRAVPERYKNMPLKVHVRSVTSDSGAATSYTTSHDNGNLVLKIGDPNRTVTGDQSYIIDYDVQNVISFYKDHDEFYWDINGTEWKQPFDRVSVQLHVPNGAHLTGPAQCFTGDYSSTMHNCKLTYQDATLTAKTTESLEPHQTLTLVAGFDKSYFTPPSVLERIGDYVKYIVMFAVPVTLFGGASWLHWRRRGRDAKGRGIIIPQYDAPDKLTPLEVGTLVDFAVENRDITATIIDLAVRGYVKIIETKDKRLLRKDKLSYVLQLKKADFTGLNDYEKAIMEVLFDTQAATGQQIDLTAAQHKFAATAQSIRTKVEAALTDAGYFQSNPLKAGSGLMICAAVLFFAVWVIGGLLGPALAFGLAVSAGVMYIFSRFMPSRTAKGVAANEHILGLKLYLQTAEAERLKMMQSPDARYSANRDEPTKTVELFEKLLPYAMVLGVENQWAKQFEHLYVSPPDWYNGNFTTFNTAYLAGSLNGGMQSVVSQAFSAPSSSSSSGFGSGGFSGGGGGGGGGGGW